MSEAPEPDDTPLASGEARLAFMYRLFAPHAAAHLVAWGPSASVVARHWRGPSQVTSSLAGMHDGSADWLAVTGMPAFDPGATVALLAQARRLLRVGGVLVGHLPYGGSLRVWPGQTVRLMSAWGRPGCPVTLARLDRLLVAHGFGAGSCYFLSPSTQDPLRLQPATTWHWRWLKEHTVLFTATRR